MRRSVREVNAFSLRGRARTTPSRPARPAERTRSARSISSVFGLSSYETGRLTGLLVVACKREEGRSTCAESEDEETGARTFKALWDVVVDNIPHIGLIYTLVSRKNEETSVAAMFTPVLTLSATLTMPNATASPGPDVGQLAISWPRERAGICTGSLTGSTHDVHPVRLCHSLPIHPPFHRLFQHARSDPSVVRFRPDPLLFEVLGDGITHGLGPCVHDPAARAIFRGDLRVGELLVEASGHLLLELDDEVREIIEARVVGAGVGGAVADLAKE